MITASGTGNFGKSAESGMDDEDQGSYIDMMHELGRMPLSMSSGMQPEFYFNNYEISMLKSLSAASFSEQSRSFER